MFKIGDKVRVIKKHAPDPGKFHHAPQMDAIIGKIGEITADSKDMGTYFVSTPRGSWWWLPESLEHVNTLHVGDVVANNVGHQYRLDKAGLRRGNENDQFRFHYSCIQDGKWKYVAEGMFEGDYKVIQKYPLRNAKGHYIKCDRYVNPLEAAVKRRKPVAKPLAPAIIEKPAVAPIKPLPEPVKAPPKAKDIRSELAKLAKAGYDGNRCNYSLEFDNGKIRHQAPDACHARLCWRGYYNEEEKANSIVNIALNIAAHHKQLGAKRREIHTRFVRYMLNDSPWADCFITKDAKEALEVGILMNVEKNVSHIVGAAVALRVATEWNDILTPFGDVLDKGYSGNVAYLCCGHLRDGKVTEWPGHSALTSTLGLADIIKFFKEGYSQKDWKGIAEDRKQTSYKIFDTICPGSGYGGDNPKGGDSLSAFTKKQAVSTKQGEGFEAKTVFDYEATLIKMADAFKKELEG